LALIPSDINRARCYSSGIPIPLFWKLWPGLSLRGLSLVHSPLVSHLAVEQRMEGVRRGDLRRVVKYLVKSRDGRVRKKLAVCLTDQVRYAVEGTGVFWDNSGVE
jgi:hypothetical protein